MPKKQDMESQKATADAPQPRRPRASTPFTSATSLCPPASHSSRSLPWQSPRGSPRCSGTLSISSHLSRSETTRPPSHWPGCGEQNRFCSMWLNPRKEACWAQGWKLLTEVNNQSRIWTHLISSGTQLPPGTVAGSHGAELQGTRSPLWPALWWLRLGSQWHALEWVTPAGSAVECTAAQAWGAGSVRSRGRPGLKAAVAFDFDGNSSGPALLPLADTRGPWCQGPYTAVSAWSTGFLLQGSPPPHQGPGKQVHSPVQCTLGSDLSILKIQLLSRQGVQSPTTRWVCASQVGCSPAGVRHLTPGAEIMTARMSWGSLFRPICSVKPIFFNFMVTQTCSCSSWKALLKTVMCSRHWLFLVPWLGQLQW